MNTPEASFHESAALMGKLARTSLDPSVSSGIRDFARVVTVFGVLGDPELRRQVFSTAVGEHTVTPTTEDPTANNNPS